MPGMGLTSAMTDLMLPPMYIICNDGPDVTGRVSIHDDGPNSKLMTYAMIDLMLLEGKTSTKLDLKI